MFSDHSLNHRPSVPTDPPTNRVVQATEARLKAAGISSPMALSALDGFQLLDGNQVAAQIAEHIIASEVYPIRIVPGDDDNLTTGKDHFNLIIDQASLEQYQSFRIANCSHFSVRSFLPTISPAQHLKFFIEILDCDHFHIEGISCVEGRNMVFIADSSSFTIGRCSCSDMEGSGIIINHGNNFSISKCFFDNNLSAAILIIGSSANGEIRDCTCSRSRGYFNHDAAIHLCSTSDVITPSHIPERCHEPIPISAKKQRPHHILIKNCTLAHCRAQGLYLEGAVNCVIEDNILLHNNKEGICLDWGSCYNIIRHNIVSLNGARRELSAEEIRVDFISDYPLLEDGSSSMKLPGLSLDNGCLNFIQENTISNNYGGGIKMIRTAMFNTISNNQVLYNAIGANHAIPYFHGITALGLGAINNEFDSTRPPLLDFMPSIMNSITENTILEHWDPFFFDRTSSNNFISGNITPHRQQIHSPLTIYYSRAKAFAKRAIAKLLRRLKP